MISIKAKLFIFSVNGLFLMLSALAFMYCAHQVAPSGGPKDEVPPKIVKTVPESGTLNFPVKKSVVLNFSEWVDIRNVKRSITVFPTLPEGFKVAVTGKRIEIKPETAFAESTTYHIGINTELTDLHSVSVGTPFSIFFSTGSSIDSGAVFGCVIDAEKRNTQPKVALYRCEKDTLPDSAYLNFPSYLIQTDSSGVFRLKHVKKGTYIILAFVDNDNNNCLTPGTEKAYASRNRKFTLEKETGPLLLFPASSDTTTSKVASIKAISATVITGEWKEEAARNIFNEEYDWNIISLDTNVQAPVIKNYIPVKDSRIFVLRLSDSLTTGSYSLIYRINPRISLPLKDSDSIKKRVGELLDTIRFNGTQFTDTIRPAFTGASPSLDANLDASVTLKWSGPVKPTFHRWFLADTLGDTVLLDVDTSFSEITEMRPVRKLTPGNSYYTLIPADYFVDFVGNHPKPKDYLTRKDTTTEDSIAIDSVPVIYIKLSTIGLRDICFSLSGKASCLEPEKQRIWRFTPLNSTSSYTTSDKNSQFRFDSIPGSKGKISCFVDYNNDNEYSHGSLFPWTPPEPCFVFSDTIEARARWDIEGIEVSACDICVKREEKIEEEPETSTIDTLKKSK